MNKRPTWGIIGAGHIAYQIADALIELNAQIRGVAARTQASAQKFAARYPGCRATSDVQQLLNDSDLDVVYIAGPNHLHLPHALAAINHGKGVLIEKPFALDSIEAEQIIAAARRAKVFCMEAMWTRFIPAIGAIKTELDAGAIGTVFGFEASFGHRTSPLQSPRLYDREMGGGSLLDLGVYLVSLGQYLFGTPHRQSASLAAYNEDTDLDTEASITCAYPGNILASYQSSIRNALPCSAIIRGELGNIEIPSPIYSPQRFKLITHPAASTIKLPAWMTGIPFSRSGLQIIKHKFSQCSPLGQRPIILNLKVLAIDIN